MTVDVVDEVDGGLVASESLESGRYKTTPCLLPPPLPRKSSSPLAFSTRGSRLLGSSTLLVASNL